MQSIKRDPVNRYKRQKMACNGFCVLRARVHEYKFNRKYNQCHYNVFSSVYKHDFCLCMSMSVSLLYAEKQNTYNFSPDEQNNIKYQHKNRALLKPSSLPSSPPPPPPPQWNEEEECIRRNIVKLLLRVKNTTKTKQKKNAHIHSPMSVER